MNDRTHKNDSRKENVLTDRTHQDFVSQNRPPATLTAVYPRSSVAKKTCFPSAITTHHKSTERSPSLCCNLRVVDPNVGPPRFYWGRRDSSSPAPHRLHSLAFQIALSIAVRGSEATKKIGIGKAHANNDVVGGYSTKPEFACLAPGMIVVSAYRKRKRRLALSLPRLQGMLRANIGP
jgi:hypothetical protein